MRQALGWRFPRDALVVSIESTDMGVSRQGGNGLHIVIRVFLHQSGGMLNALTVDIVGERFAREIGDGSLDVGTVGMEQSGHLVDLQVRSCSVFPLLYIPQISTKISTYKTFRTSNKNFHIS